MKENERYLNFACDSFSRHFFHITIDDLKQECYIKLLEIVRRNKGKSKNEISKIYRTSIFNTLRDIYRREKYRATNQLEVKYDAEDEAITIDIADTIDVFENLVYQQYCEAIKEKLTGIDKRVFELFLIPNDSLIKIAEENFKRQNERRKAGKLVMNVNRVKIMSKHVAELLNISNATMSRSVQRIRNLTLQIIEK